MNSRLYRIAYKFLRLRKDFPGKVAERYLLEQSDEDRPILIKFLTYNHNIKFL